MSYNLTVVRMTTIKILQIIDAGKGIETREPFDTIEKDLKEGPPARSSQQQYIWFAYVCTQDTHLSVHSTHMGCGERYDRQKEGCTEVMFVLSYVNELCIYPRLWLQVGSR